MKRAVDLPRKTAVFPMFFHDSGFPEGHPPTFEFDQVGWPRWPYLQHLAPSGLRDLDQELGVDPVFVLAA